MLKDSYNVEKSKALVWAQFTNYGAGELKILDTYLSRINARDSNSSCVKFTKKEYAELMGLAADVRTSQLKTYTRSLLSNVVTMDLPGKGYVQYPLFSEARCEYSEELNQTVIEIDCNPKLKQAFFDLAEDGYVLYKLKNIISLKSQYGMRLYPMLKDKPFGWTVEISELKKNLGATSSTYNEFKRFNDLVLKKAVNEINENTDIFVTYEKIKKGRAIHSIRFNPITSSALPTPEDVIEVEEEAVVPEWTENVDDPLALFAEALPEGLSRDQVQFLKDEALKKLPGEGLSQHEKDLRVYEYLWQKTKKMRAQRKPVHPNAYFSWLSGAIDGDW